MYLIASTTGFVILFGLVLFATIMTPSWVSLALVGVFLCWYRVEVVFERRDARTHIKGQCPVCISQTFFCIAVCGFIVNCIRFYTNYPV